MKVKTTGGVKTYVRGCGDAGTVDCSVAQSQDVQCSGDVSQTQDLVVGLQQYMAVYFS